MLPKLVDMAVEAGENDGMYPMAVGGMDNSPRYPYGLSISLTEKELEKLDLDTSCEVGDLIHLFAMAKVTSVSQNETQKGTCCRVELQIMFLGLEDEDEEEKEAKPKYKLGSLSRHYK